MVVCLIFSISPFFFFSVLVQVTISLALSIVTILGTVWTILDTLPEIMFSHHYDSLDQEVEENVTVTDYSPYRSEVLMDFHLVMVWFVKISGGVWTLPVLVWDRSANPTKIPSTCHCLLRQRLAVEGVLLVVFLFYTFGGGVIVIVMSTLAGAALRPTKSQVENPVLVTDLEGNLFSMALFHMMWFHR